MTDTMQKNKNIAEVLQKTAKKSKKQKILTVSGVFILFLAVFLFYVYCSVFDKRIRIYYDELRYLHIAKNLWLDHSLKIYEYDTDFQKILYSVFLAPFYSIKNSVLRIKAISAFNAFLAASSVFPGYLIAKKITSDRKIIFISLVILALSPDMCYSMIFMSETLYLPLGLWQIYLFIRLFEAETLRKKIVLALLCGAFNYFLYLTKEVAVIFPISFFIISVIGAFYEKKNAKQKIITFSAYFIAFISFFLVFKLTLFSGMGNSYDQTNLSQIGTLYKFEFFIYSLIYNFIFLLVGLFWFPVVYPAFKITKMKKSNRNLYVFLIIAFFLCMAVVGFTISVREDLGKEWVRQHQRYYSIFFMPFFILFADSAINCRNEIENHKNAYYSILSGITSAFLMLVFFFIKKPEMVRRQTIQL